MNRIKEAQADIRRCDRDLEKYAEAAERFPDWMAKRKAYRQQCVEKEQYWTQYLREHFGDESPDKLQFGKHNVKPGDWILGRWGWQKVVRSNAKSASVKNHSDTQSWNDTTPWEEVKKHMTADEWDSFAGEKVKHPQCNWYSLVPSQQEATNES